MSEDEKKKIIFSNIFAKIKRVKHLDVILTVLFVAIILLIYFSAVSSSNTTNGSEQNSDNIVKSTNDESEEDLLLNYTNEIEEKLQTIISKLKNSGNVSVKVTLNGPIEYVIAYSTQTTINLDGSKVEVKSPVLITNDNISSPIILQTIMPKISSVVVVATGAKDTSVKLEIIKIIQTLYEIQSSKIEVFAGN